PDALPIYIRSGRRPGHPRRTAVELNEAAILVGILGEIIAMDVAVADERQPHDGLLQRGGLGRDELRVKPGRRHFLGIVILEEGPGTDVLVAVLHAVLPISAMRGRGHAPL